MAYIQIQLRLVKGRCSRATHADDAKHCKRPPNICTVSIYTHFRLQWERPLSGRVSELSPDNTITLSVCPM